MEIIRKSRGAKIPKQAQRVFFSCDKKNGHEKEQLISDLLSFDAGMDCVVSYCDTNDYQLDERLIHNELQDTQLLILWVTKELLQTIKDGEFPIEYSIARQLLTPILPIASDGGLFPRFTELAGAVHGISMTDIEYRSKLKAQLENFLVQDAIIQEIQAKAFTASLFLSYRKMDIENARSFMKVLHDIEELQAVSIWYDSFLTAGRNFDDEIEKSITNSDVFVLLVTPNLVIKGNYVQTTEYPYAQKTGKPVLTVESSKTDKNSFNALFPNAQTPVSIDDPESLHMAFTAKLPNKASVQTTGSERDYLLGTAYLKGFGLERDFDRGVILLEKSAGECGIPGMNAAKQLAQIYEDGFRIAMNLDKALKWRSVVSDYCERQYGINSIETVNAYCSVATVCRAKGDSTEAIEWYRKAEKICDKISRKSPEMANIHFGMATAYASIDDAQEAIKQCDRSLKIRQKVLGKESIDVARIYNAKAVFYSAQGDVLALAQRDKQAAQWYYDAAEFYQKALVIYENLFGTNHYETAMIYVNIGALSCSLRDYKKSLEMLFNAQSICEGILGKDHIYTANIYSSISFTYYRKKDADRAIEFSEKALSVLTQILGEKHPDTINCCANLGTYYFNKRDYDNTFHYNQKVLKYSIEIYGKEDIKVAIAYTDSAMTYNAWGDYDKSIEFFLRAFYIFRREMERGHPLQELANRRIKEIGANFRKNGGSTEDFRKIEALVRKDYAAFDLPLYFIDHIFFDDIYLHRT